MFESIEKGKRRQIFKVGPRSQIVHVEATFVRSQFANPGKKITGEKLRQFSASKVLNRNFPEIGFGHFVKRGEGGREFMLHFPRH